VNRCRRNFGRFCTHEKKKIGSCSRDRQQRNGEGVALEYLSSMPACPRLHFAATRASASVPVARLEQKSDTARNTNVTQAVKKRETANDIDQIWRPARLELLAPNRKVAIFGAIARETCLPASCELVWSNGATTCMQCGRVERRWQASASNAAAAIAITSLSAALASLPTRTAIATTSLQVQRMQNCKRIDRFFFFFFFFCLKNCSTSLAAIAQQNSQ
jgi:hypothetical protein